jgi:kynureninase
MDLTDPERALRLDEGDELADFRTRLVVAEPDLVYLDGNSLGRLPERTVKRLLSVMTEEWGDALIRSWDGWQEMPVQVGDLIAEHLVGARPGEVAVSDSTSVNLYKLATAAVDARQGRGVMVTDDDNFPSDRYVLAGVAERAGLELRLIHTDIDEGVDPDVLAAAIDDDVALVSLSHVAYRSGALADMGLITSMVHDAGAMMLWDLCHSVGAVPVDLHGCQADLAVGCTYKHLDGGPGAPAFLYVREDLQDSLRQPIWGWFGQTDQFEMGPDYEPLSGIRRFLVGSPTVLGLACVEEGVRLMAEAGIDRIRSKAIALTEYLIELADAWLVPLGFRIASPRDAARRGSHVSLYHPEAYRISRALVEKAGVVGDYRTPDRLRLGPSPLATSFAELREGMLRIRDLVDEGLHLDMNPVLRSIT